MFDTFCSILCKKLHFSELPHSSMDSHQESKQNYTLSFRELHKIQRQVLQPSPAYVTDQAAAVASGSFTKVTQDSGLDDGFLHGRHAFSAGSQSQVKNKTQVFLPGRKCILLSCPQLLYSTVQNCYKRLRMEGYTLAKVQIV